MQSTFRKKSHKTGTIRDYGKYGQYEKQENGTWKRLCKGYPTFRRTLSFRLMKSYLSNELAYGDVFLEQHSGTQLRKMLSTLGKTRSYNRWVKEHGIGEKAKEN